MTNIKTAISVQKELFEEIDAVAEEMEISRSRLISLAARDFINKHRSQKLLEAINEAYNDQYGKDEAEENLKQKMKTRQRNMVRNEW